MTTVKMKHRVEKRPGISLGMISKTQEMVALTGRSAENLSPPKLLHAIEILPTEQLDEVQGWHDEVTTLSFPQQTLD